MPLGERLFVAKSAVSYKSAATAHYILDPSRSFDYEPAAVAFCRRLIPSHISSSFLLLTTLFKTPPQ